MQRLYSQSRNSIPIYTPDYLRDPEIIKDLSTEAQKAFRDVKKDYIPKREPLAITALNKVGETIGKGILTALIFADNLWRMIKPAKPQPLVLPPPVSEQTTSGYTTTVLGSNGLLLSELLGDKDGPNKHC